MVAVALVMRVLPVEDSDQLELAQWAGQLYLELQDLDHFPVELLIPEVAPEGAKGAGAFAAGLAARLTTVDGVRALIAAVRGFVSRTGRSVEVSIGDDKLIISHATAEQQEKVIDAWLARHAVG